MPPSQDPLLFQLTELLTGDQPDLAAARQLLDRIARDRPDLLPRAQQLFRLYTPADDSAPAGGQGALATARRVLAVPGRWGYLGAAALLALAYVGYQAWPAPGGMPPVEAKSPFPASVPQFEPTGDGHFITFQHGRLVSLNVLPAPAGINLNGALTTWDVRGRFRSAWAAPYENERYIEGCLLLDDQNLYIGAHVGDPWPMRSTVPDAEDAQSGWEGGGLQLRLATGAKHPGDLQTAYPPDRLVHLTLWYCQPAEKPYLRVNKGMAFAEKRRPLAGGQEGFDAAFHEDADGRGYVVKARVAWKVLGVEAAPHGRELGLCWETCWSDPAGQRCVGKLTEFFDPDRLRHLEGISPADRLPGKQSYQRPEVWGKAICAPRP